MMGFTLLELLVVMGIMAVLMSMGVAGFIGMRRGAEIRSAVSVVQSTLMLARQQAVTKRRAVEVYFYRSADFATNWMQVIEITSGGTNVPVHGDVVMSPGVVFESMPDKIAFSPLGKAGSVDVVVPPIIIAERTDASKPQKKVITVWPLTGACKVVDL